MNNGQRNIGVVSLTLGRAEIVEVKSDANGSKWAMFRVPIGQGDQGGLVQIADSRPETVKAAETALEVSTQYFRARKAAKTALEDERLRTLHEARATLNSGVAEAVIQRSVVGGGRREKVQVALFPTDEEPTGILAMVHTKGRYERYPMNLDERPLVHVKGPKGRQVISHLHIVFTDKDPIYVWELDHSYPMLFKVSVSGGFEIRVFEPKIAPTEEDATAEVETDEVETETPAKTPAPRPNGKVAVVCSNDDCGHTSEILPKNVGQSRCKKCKTGTLVLAE